MAFSYSNISGRALLDTSASVLFQPANAESIALLMVSISQSAHADSLTGTVPSPQWGYGKVDAYAALRAVQATVPRLSLALLTNRQPQVTVTQTIAGWQYVLQSSTSLASWLSVLTNTASTNSLKLLDPDTLTQARFYRVVVP